MQPLSSCSLVESAESKSSRQLPVAANHIDLQSVHIVMYYNFIFLASLVMLTAPIKRYEETTHYSGYSPAES